MMRCKRLNWTGLTLVAVVLCGWCPWIAALALVADAAYGADDKPKSVDPFSRIEGPGLPFSPEGAAPKPGAVILPSVPADYDWWNGCSPTAGGMLFGWWEENGYDAFPGNHRNLPPTFPGTSTNPADYNDARGVIAGWAHKQSGMAQSLTYGSYENHAPDSIADFMLTRDSGTSRSTMAHGFEAFGAWDDPRTPAIESRRFTATTVYTSGGWTYNDYCNEINAGRPVHLGLTSTAGGHSVLGVGYNNTAGKQDIVLLTTWHSGGPQEWEWANETQSGYHFSVYGGTKLTANPAPHPLLSAYLSLAHTYVGDLAVELGVGSPESPLWSTTAWSHGGGSDANLALTDIDCTAALPLFQAGNQNWYLKVTDNTVGDQGTIEDFQIRYGFDQTVFDYAGNPVPIKDNQTSYVYLTTLPVPEPSTLVLLTAGLLGLACCAWRRRRSSASDGVLIALSLLLLTFPGFSLVAFAGELSADGVAGFAVDGGGGGMIADPGPLVGFVNNVTQNSTDWGTYVVGRGGVVNNHVNFDTHPLGTLQGSFYVPTDGVALSATGVVNGVKFGQGPGQSNTSTPPLSTGEGTHPASRYLEVGSGASSLTVSFSSPVMGAGMFIADYYNPYGDNPITLAAYSGQDASGTLMGSFSSAAYNFQPNNLYFMGLATSDGAGIGSVRLSVAGTLSDIVAIDDIRFAAVPEPSTLVLLGVGAFSLLACAWRRRRSSASDGVLRTSCSSFHSTRRCAMKRLLILGACIVLCSSLVARAGSVLVSGPHFLGYGYGDYYWQNFTNALNVATGNQVTVASDFSNLGQVLSYDALLLPPRQTSDTLSTTELGNLSAFISTGRRVILMGENSNWIPWNNQILGLVGGTFAGETSGTTNAVLSHSLTNGAATIYLPTCGLANGGTALYDRNVATLWGQHENVLTMLNVNVWEDSYWSSYNNGQFGTNAAVWLATPVPEPSTLVLLGVGALGLLAYVWRRRRAGGSPLSLSWFSRSRATNRPQLQRRCVMKRSMRTMLAVLIAVVLTWASTANAIIISQTIDKYNGPYYTSGDVYPKPAAHIGDFTYVIPIGETIVSASLSGQWGNSDMPTTAHNKVYVDGIEVANTYLASPNPYYTSYVPWSYTYANFSTLADGAASLDVVQWSEYNIRLAPTTLTIGTAPVPEPSTLVLLSVGALGLLAYAWRRRRS